MNVVSSYRAMAFFNYLGKSGILPTLITHNWDVDGRRVKNELKTESKNNGIIIRIPLISIKQKKWKSVLKKIPLGNKMSILLSWIRGYHDPNFNDYVSYLSFKKECFNLLKTNKYDVVIAIYSPHHHLKLCYELHEKFGVPYVLDFRDLWPGAMFHKKYQPNFTEKIQNHFTQKNWKIWLSKAIFFSSISIRVYK